jgi:TolB-like protein
MKNRLFLVLLSLFFTLNVFCQPLRVAILDFDNISGIAKYDGLGKAMSSMLISDIESNVSPKRLQLVERAQINKILKEQNFQKTGNVDKNTSIKIGKLLGVKYLLIGDVYILNDVLVLNARLTDAESGDIKFSKKQEGKLAQWLSLKTNIAKDLSKEISMPFTEPNIPDKEINVAVITNFGNAIAAKDTGNVKKAEELINTVQDFSPDFKYIEDLKLQIEELKKQVLQNTADIKVLDTKIDETIEDPFSLAREYITNNRNLKEAIRYLNFFLVRKDNLSVLDPVTKKLFVFYRLAEAYGKLGLYPEAFAYLDSCKNIDDFFMREKMSRSYFLIKSDKTTGLNHTEEIINGFNSILKYSREDSRKFNSKLTRSSSLPTNPQCASYFDANCDFYSASTLTFDDGKTYGSLDMDMFLNLCRKIFILNKISVYYYDNKNYFSAIQVLENGLSKIFTFLEENKDNFYSDIRFKDMNFDIKNITEYRSLTGQQNTDQQLFNKYWFFLHDEQSFAQSIEILAKCYIANNQIDKAIDVLQYYYEIIDNFKDSAGPNSEIKINISGVPWNYSSKEESEFYIDKFLISSALYRISIVINDVKAKEYYYSISSKLYDNPSIKKWLVNEYGIDYDYSSFEKFSTKLVLELTELNKNAEKSNKSQKSTSINFNRKINDEIINSASLKDFTNVDFQNKKAFTLGFLDVINDDFNKSEQGLKYFSFNIKTLDNKLSDKSNQKYSSLNVFFNRIIFKNEIELISKLKSGDKITLIFTADKNNNNFVYGDGEFLSLGWCKFENTDYNMKKLYDISKKNGLLIENEICISLKNCLITVKTEKDYLECCKSKFNLNELYEIYYNDAVILNNLSWSILNQSESNDDFIVCELMSERANFITEYSDHNNLSTYAAILKKNGKINLAKEKLKIAINEAEKISDKNSVEKYRNRLMGY